MKPYNLLHALSTTISLSAFTQDSVVSVATISRRGIDEQMNRTKITPLLTDKVHDTQVHDVYRLKDGMICIVPDSAILQRMRIIKPKQR
jgi:hypothetical protein